MPILRINAPPQGPTVASQRAWQAAISAVLATPAGQGPITILIHGYRYAPGATPGDPHDLIYATSAPKPHPRVVSWPRHLGYGTGRDHEGLCIAFGWPARGSVWAAYAQAEKSAVVLAQVLNSVARQTDQPINVVCHSLGARVALAALRQSATQHVGRVIMMAGAEHRHIAADVATDLAPRGAQLLNICSRENDIFDTIFELSMLATGKTGRALGQGLKHPCANWIDIQIDAPQTRAALLQFGVTVPPPARAVCHWSAYLRPGLWRLYRKLIRDLDDADLQALRKDLPTELSPKWSALKWSKNRATKPSA